MEKFEVPEDIINQGSSGLSAGDTTFVQIKPSWGSNYGFVNPSEISIAQDGRVYIVDSSASSIHVLNQDGDKPLGFEGLLNLADDSGIQINPTDVDIDKKMNVFFHET